MSLQYHNWITLEGISVPGAVPPQVLVRGPFPLTSAQRSQLAGAYLLFSHRKRTGITPYLTQQVTLADGTRVRFESIQNRDRVFVEPPGGERRETPPHGIGICFTGQESEPLAGFAYDVDEETLPLPFILVPGVGSTEGGWPFPADNTWSAINVTRLVGGQQLWVHESGRDWCSNFAEYLVAMPAALVASVIRQPIDVLRIRTQWVALSMGRIPTGFSSEPGALPFSDRGQYIFRSNDTLQLNTDAFTQKSFFADLDVGDGPAKYRVIIRPTLNSLRMYRGPYAEIKGLAEEDADLSGDNVYLAEQPAYTPSDSTVRFEPNTLSVHPSGKFAKCIAYRTTGQNGLCANITVGDTLSVDVVDVGVERAPIVVTGGSLTWAEEATQAPVPVTVYTTAFTCELDENNIPITEEVANENLDLYSAFERTATGTGQHARNERRLNRHFYDLAGNVVTESVESDTVNNIEFNWHEQRSGYDGRYQFDAFFNPVVVGHTSFTYELSAVINRSSSEVVVQTIGGTSLTTQQTQRTINQTITRAFAGGTNIPEPQTFTVTASGAFSNTTRQVLFTDEINDFYLYLESAFTANLSGTIVDATSANISGLIGGKTATATLKGVHNGAVVFSHLAGQFDTVATAACDGSVWPGVASLWDVTLNQSANPPELTPRSINFDGLLLTRCSGETLNASAETAPDSRTYEWNEVRNSESSAPMSTRLGAPLFNMSWQNQSDPRFHTEVRFARDPLTLACVVNLSFYGTRMLSGESPDQTWSFAITKTAFKTVQQVMADIDRPLPDNAWIYPDATLHSLVSI